MQILFQLPKNFPLSALPPYASVGTNFAVDGVEYTIVLGSPPDAGVLIKGVLLKIDALYIVKPKEKK